MNVTRYFVRRLPKSELHAHLSGSIRSEHLHDLWVDKQSRGQCLDLEDPLQAVRPGGKHHDISTFFPLFDKYIYTLLSDIDSVKLATARVVEDFRLDGVVYLELRTTPREHSTSGLTKEAYVEAIHEVLQSLHQQHAPQDGNSHPICVRLILSIDRRMNAEQAMEVVDLALRHRDGRALYSSPTTQASNDSPSVGLVVGVDLCGNPMKGDVTTLSPAFRRAKESGLKITLHFAEISQSATDSELETLLSWEPDRLGHVIHVPERFKRVIEDRGLGLELCLSCNVLAGMTNGGFAAHHFGEWYRAKCAVALSTDDVGVFDSRLSNEYFLAAQHFGLGRKELVQLASQSASAAFWSSENVELLIRQFEQNLDAT